MTSRAIRVSAQWALEGKEMDGDGFRLLACSTGPLERGNFDDALSRFRVGELKELPQVSVSWARLGTQPGQSYLALAIHWYATEGEGYADEVAPRDNVGRATPYTSYFCLPYHKLATEAIGYVAMYHALRAVRLTTRDGPPVDVRPEVPASLIPAANDLAVRVAPLLLTGQSVCVLGAEGTSTLERLEFIDNVMQLLPYGFRSRMTAATWLRAASREHGFRLFFSSAPPAAGTDYVVKWDGHPDLVRVHDREASDYLDWLQDNLGPLTHLADLKTDGLRFSNRKDVLQAVESALGGRPRYQSRPRAVTPAISEGPGRPAADQGDSAEAALYRCAGEATTVGKLRGDIRALQKLAAGGVDADRRKKYRELIARLGLLRDQPRISARDEERLYEALLRLGFRLPLGYEDYCRVEAYAGIPPGDMPHRELLAAIQKCGAGDTPTTVIVYWHLRQADRKKLGAFYAEVDPVMLIKQLAGPWTHPEHAKIFCDATLEYLDKESSRYQPLLVREALCQHGFLARALQLQHPDNDQYQVYALYRFLKAAYPQPANTPGQDLSRPAIVQILGGGTASLPPTPALLSAVLMLLSKPGSYQLAYQAYIRGSVTSAHLDAQTRARLDTRLPAPLDASAIKPPEPELQHDPARPAGADAGGGS